MKPPRLPTVGTKLKIKHLILPTYHRHQFSKFPLPSTVQLFSRSFQPVVSSPIEIPIITVKRTVFNSKILDIAYLHLVKFDLFFAESTCFQPALAILFQVFSKIWFLHLCTTLRMYAGNSKEFTVTQVALFWRQFPLVRFHLCSPSHFCPSLMHHFSPSYIEILKYKFHLEVICGTPSGPWSQ